MDLDMCTGVELIIKAIQNENKDKLYLQYCSLLPYMTDENYISFEEFYNKVVKTTPKISKEQAYNNAINIIGNIL